MTSTQCLPFIIVISVFKPNFQITSILAMRNVQTFTELFERLSDFFTQTSVGNILLCGDPGNSPIFSSQRQIHAKWNDKPQKIQNMIYIIYKSPPNFFLKHVLFRFPSLTFCLSLSFTTCGRNWLNGNSTGIYSHRTQFTIYTFCILLYTMHICFQVNENNLVFLLLV